MEKTLKILLADESAEQRRFLREALISNGYRSIEEAANGEEAIIKIERQHPNIVIIDSWLSKVDGLGVIRRSKAISFAPDLRPIFILTSMVHGNTLFIEATNAGADLCLVKPIDTKSLLLHIESLAHYRTG
ncbi:MAG: response regulator, partial [Clostridia bacterium]|nr:response regulator [Clostridia bacterium]